MYVHIVRVLLNSKLCILKLFYRIHFCFTFNFASLFYDMKESSNIVYLIKFIYLFLYDSIKVLSIDLFFIFF